jgi:hypothetical protein
MIAAKIIQNGAMILDRDNPRLMRAASDVDCGREIQPPDKGGSDVAAGDDWLNCWRTASQSKRRQTRHNKKRTAMPCTIPLMMHQIVYSLL